MSENQIKVTATTNKPLRVNVTAPDTQGNVTLSPDTSAYNAGLAEQWAISDKLVLGKDYSSKYYANQAKENALSVESFAEDVSSIYNSFTEISEQAINELNTTRDEAIVTINERFEEGLGEGANQITELVNSSIAEYTEISNQIKQDNSEASKLAQDWAISEVLVDNIDYSAKYYAEKAKDNSGIFYDELTDEDIDVEILDTNYATKSDLELGLDTKQDKGDYATRTELSDGLATKQAKGNYALKSDIPNISNLATKDELPTQVSELENDSNYATQTQVMQAIASIPQFNRSIVDELPTTGEKMTLYLVPKEGTNNDVYNEYIWIEQTSSFEFLGTTVVDLTDYVKNTDYATTDKAGVIKTTTSYGVAVSSTTGTLYGATKSLALYNSANDVCIVCKGTLNNVLTQYSKTVLTTEADYEALETKDANTLYLIEE